ncbi:MAG: hypothetical protein HeimC2_00540 [Candidatus Heimdallarchaeota archaeon LC_2]|nr:MAG: hypothetical protein HeimC2_00540 [Candidatus Heimdallarchaeota archaeon LC_2]
MIDRSKASIIQTRFSLALTDISPIYFKLVKDSLNSTNNWEISKIIAQTVAPNLLMHDELDLILEYFDLFLDFKEKAIGVSLRELRPILEPYYFEELLNFLKSQIEKLDWNAFYSIIMKKIELSHSSNFPFFTYYGIYLIHNLDDEIDSDNYQGHIINLLCNLITVQSDQVINEIYSNYIDHKIPIFRRIGIYILDIKYEILNESFWLNYKKNPIDDFHIKPELWRFFRNRYGDFSAKEQEKVNAWVENLKHEYDKTEIDTDRSEKLLANRKREWYTAFLDDANSDIKQRIVDLENIDDSEFSVLGHHWKIGRLTVFDTQPEDLSDLAKSMSPEEFINYINSAKFDNLESYITSNSVGYALTSIIEKHPSLFVSDLQPFLKLKEKLLPDLFGAIITLLNQDYKYNFDFLIGHLYGQSQRKLEYHVSDYIHFEHGGGTSIDLLSEICQLLIRNNASQLSKDNVMRIGDILLSLETKLESNNQLEPKDTFLIMVSTPGKLYTALIDTIRLLHVEYGTTEKYGDQLLELMQDAFLALNGNIVIQTVLGVHLNVLHNIYGQEFEKLYSSSVKLEETSQTWRNIISGYLSYSKIYIPTFNYLRKRGDFKLVLGLNDLSEDSERGLVEKVVLSYLNESVIGSKNNELMENLLNTQSWSKLKYTVWSFHKIWEQNESLRPSQDTIIDLWTKILVSTKIKNNNLKEIIMQLWFWLDYVSEFSTDIYDKLIRTLKLVKVNGYDLYKLSKFLMRQSSLNPYNCGKLLLEMIKLPEIDYIEDDLIKSVLSNLFQSSDTAQYELAVIICNQLTEKGNFNHTDLCQEYML